MKIFDVNWKATTAGPSPCNNERTEVFLYGCNRAIQGKECAGCFNNTLQNNNDCIKTYDVDEIVDNIMLHSPNIFVTFGGGEPSDQIDELIDVCKELKNNGYHIMVYTWRKLINALNNDDEGISIGEGSVADKFNLLLNNIDILVDGQYDMNQRIYNTEINDGLLNSVGSANQIIWNIKERHGYSIKDILQLKVNENKKLIYLLKDNCMSHIY